MKFVREDVGKLLIRIIIGAILTAKGVVFFVRGKTALIALGKILNILGVTSWPLVFGWGIAVICLIFGMTFLLGIFFKTTTFLLGSVSLFEALFKYFTGNSFMDIVIYPIVLSVVMYGFMFIGPGHYAVQK